MSTPHQITIPLHDFRLASTIQISREPRRHPLSEVIEAALTLSYKNQALMPVAATGLRLYADLSIIDDGNALFLIDTQMWLGHGRVAAGATLCSVAVACQQATAPLVWRGVLNRYLSYIASAPFGHRLGAPGLMPRTTPWLCGFSTLAKDRLTAPELQSLNTVIELVGSQLLGKCESGVRRAVSRGKRPVADPTQFPELLDWES